MITNKLVEVEKQGLMTALQDTGASQEVIKFYTDTLECELDIQHTIYKLSCKLKNEIGVGCEAPPPSVIFALLQTMTKHFQRWQSQIDDLSRQGDVVTPLQLTQHPPSNYLTALCSLETNHVNMREGEQLQITDSSHPNWLKVRTSCGDEGFLPSISCFVATPDCNAITAIERLQLLLLTSWAECIRELRPMLASSCADCYTSMSKHWNTFLNSPYHHRVTKKDKLTLRIKRFSDITSGSKTTVDLIKLRRIIFKLENELLNINICNGLSDIKTLAGNLDRAILCYESLFNQWSKYRDSLNATSARPVRIVEHWEELRRASKFQKFKFYEMKITLNESQVFEDIEYTKEHPGEAYTSEHKRKRQIIKSEKLTTAKGEEKKRYVIKGVKDPRTDALISLKQAVSEGIIHYTNGLFVNPDTGESMPLQSALSERRIVVEYTSTVLSPTQTSATPLISIKRRADKRYTITGAIDARTAEKVDLEEAHIRGLIVDDLYVNKLDDTTMALSDAVEDGWVLATFDDTSPQFSYETHAVTGVLDRRINMLLSFDRAVSRGLIQPQSGDYVDDGRLVYAGDAISNGWIITQPFLEEADAPVLLALRQSSSQELDKSDAEKNSAENILINNNLVADVINDKKINSKNIIIDSTGDSKIDSKMNGTFDNTHNLEAQDDDVFDDRYATNLNPKVNADIVLHTNGEIPDKKNIDKNILLNSNKLDSISGKVCIPDHKEVNGSSNASDNLSQNVDKESLMSSGDSKAAKKYKNKKKSR